MTDTPIPTRFRWWVLLAIAVSSVCTGMVIMSFAPLIGEVAKDLKVDLGTASFGLLGVTMFATAVGTGLLGFWIDRVGIFPIIIGGQLLILLSTLAIPLAGNHLIPLVVIRILQGVGSSALAVAISPAMAVWFPWKEMGRAMGLQSIGMAVGIMSGLNGAPFLSQLLGTWHWGLALLSIVPLIALVVTVPIAIASRHHAAAASGVKPGADVVPASTFLRLPTFWLGLVALCLCYWAGLAFNSLAPGYLAVDHPVGAGYGPQGAGSLMLLFTLTGVVGPPLGGFLIDKMFLGHCKPVIAIGWVLGAVCYAGIMLSAIDANRAVLSMLLLVAGLSNPFINVTLMTYAAKVFPPQVVGRVSGLWLSLGFFAGSAGLMACSLALRTTGTYTLSFLIIAASCLLGLGLAPFLTQPQRSSAYGH